MMRLFNNRKRLLPLEYHSWMEQNLNSIKDKHATCDKDYNKVNI